MLTDTIVCICLFVYNNTKHCFELAACCMYCFQFVEALANMPSSVLLFRSEIEGLGGKIFSCMFPVRKPGICTCKLCLLVCLVWLLF